jgi:serine/threonine protein kinase
MSPERFSGSWQISPQADMYSLGMMLVQLLCGILPFRIEEKNPYEEIIWGSYMENARQILHVKSKRLERIIYSCIHPLASMRPSTYSALIYELRHCQ